jgi:hypothetical protein
MAFDFEGAIAAGYSVGEINDYLSKQYNFDVSGAKKAGYSDDEILEHLITYKPPPPPEPEEAGVMGRLSDAAIDLFGKGTLGLAEAGLGLANMATLNLAGEIAEGVGYDPKGWREKLDTLYTEERQAEQKKVQAAEGFWGTLEAMIEDPATILGVGLESAPQMIGGAGAVRMAATKLIAKAGITAEALTTAAGKKAAQEVLKQNAGKLATIGGAAESAMAAGSIQEQARQEGREWGESVPYALLGGLGTGAIGAIGGRFLPTAETALGTAGLTGATGRASRALVTGAGEAAQELGQSSQEQVMTNLALGRPWDENVGQAAAMGLLAGAGMGAVTGSLTGGESAETEQAAPPSTEEDKRQRVRELTVDIAEYQRNLEEAGFSEQAINEQLAMPDITQERRSELQQRLKDIGKNKTQLTSLIDQYSTELESLTQTTQAPPAALNPVAPPPAAEPTPTPPPNFANPELQSYVERMLVEDPITLLNQMSGGQGFMSLFNKQEANEIAVLKRNLDDLYEQADVAQTDLERNQLLAYAQRTDEAYEARVLEIASTAARRNLYGSTQQAGNIGSGAGTQMPLFAGIPGAGSTQGTQQQGVGSSVGSAGQTAGGAGQSTNALTTAQRQQQAAGNFKTFGAILPGAGLDLQGGQAPRRPNAPPPTKVEQDFGPPQTQDELRFQRGEPQGETQTERPWYFSQLERSLEANGNKKAPAKQWLGVLQNTPGVKPAELEDTGVKAFLESMPADQPVLKDDLLAFIKKGGVQVIEQEGEYGGSPGAYRDYVQRDMKGQGSPTSNYREMLLTLPGEDKYTSPHFDQSNILAHIRTTDRKIDGKNVLFVEEVQSDWGQEGKKTKFKPAPSAEEKRQMDVEMEAIQSEIDSLEYERHHLAEDKESAASYLHNWYIRLLEEKGHIIPKSYAERSRSIFSAYTMQRLLADNSYDPIVLLDIARSGTIPLDVKNNIESMAVAYLAMEFPRSQSEYESAARVLDSIQAEAKELNKAMIEASGKDYEQSHTYLSEKLNEKIRDLESKRNNIAEIRYRQSTPKGPFVTSTDAWTSLALKRVLTRAAQEGYDRVDFVTGKESQEVVGGGLEGQEKYYGEILPKNLAKILKPIGGVIAPQKDSSVPGRFGVEITPALKEKLLGGLPLYRRQGATPTAPRLTETQTRAYVNQLTKNWKNAPKITVVQSVKDLPDDLRGRVFDDAKGFILGDKVYVVADNAPDLHSVTGTIFHESLGHYGLKQQFQTRLDSLLKGIYDTNTAIRKATDEWLTRNADTYASLPEDQQLIRAVEEVLAEVSEAGQVKHVGLRAAINKFVAFIRDYARRMGFEVDFSNNDVAQILRQAHERVVGKGITAGLDTETVKPMFLGARNANPEARANYSVAEEMEKKGEPMEAIRLVTGWARNKNDNKWRYEVTDKNASLKLPMKNWPADATVKDVFDHPALFEAYPYIKDIPVVKFTGKSALGMGYMEYGRTRGQGSFELGVRSTNQNPLSTILHELQHYIQAVERHAAGGTEKNAVDYLLRNDQQIIPYYDDIVEALERLSRTEHGKKARDMLRSVTAKHQNFFSSKPEGVKLREDVLSFATKDDKFSNLIYENISGEMEARETQTRQGMSENERRVIRPDTLGNVVDKKAITMYQRSGLPPVALQEFIRYQRSMGQVDPARPDRSTINKLVDTLYGFKSRSAREIFIKSSSLDMMRQIFETRNRPLSHAIRMLEKAMGRKDSSVMRGREEIEKNLRRWQGVLKNAQPQVVDKWQAIVRDSTMLQIDVEAASSRTLVQQVDSGARARASLTPEEDNVYALTKQFLALPSPMRQMYSELRQAYKGYYTRYFNAIAAMSPSVAAKIKQDFMANMMSVYFPLTRKGDFWVSYQDANNDTWVEAFENERERDDFVKTLNSTAGVTAVTPYSKLGTADFHKSAPNSGFLADVMEKLRGANIPVQLQNEILEDYLNHLPSKSVLQQFNKRKRGPTGQLASPLGAKIDPMQAYATVASRFNNNIAVLRYTPDMETALKDAEVAFKSGNQADDLAAVTVDALKSQVAMSMTPRYGLIDKAGTGVYYMTMAANVSSAFMNLFSLPMISMSVLAGRHGLTNTTKLFFGKNGVFRTVFKGGFDTNTDSMPDFTAFAGKNANDPEMQRLYKELISRSVIRRSTGFDIRDVESSDVRDYTGGWAKTKRFMGYMMHNTERFTREATAIGAYKLARKAGKNQRDAIEDAIDTVYETHGTGITETGPQLFQHGVGRMAYILKRYAHTMLWLQYKLFKNATKGATPAVKKEARRQLLYVFGTTFAVAGVRGLPTVGGALLLASILNGMFGDDDEPYDVEAEFDQIFGKYGKGGLNALTGLEFASRTSLTDLLMRSDERRLGEIGPMLYTLEKIFGPVVSIGANIERGVSQMKEGNFARGVESMSPAAARNILKGYRYFKEDARTVDGTKLIADVDKYNAFMQMAGFSSTEVMRANERARVDVKTAKFLTDRKKSLYDKFFLALFNEDEEGMNEVIEEIKTFNEKNPLVAISAEGLRSSVKNKMVGVYQSVDGIYQPPKTRLAGSKYYDYSAEREEEEEEDYEGYEE